MREGLRPRPGEPRHRLGHPRRGPQHATKAGDGPCTGHGPPAVGREGAKYRAHANPTHTHTSPPKPFPPRPFPPGPTRHVSPPAPERSPPGVTLPQLQRQRDARRVIQEGGDGAQADLRASHGSAERGTGGDRGSAQGHTQGARQGTRGKEQGRKHGRGTEASSSGGGQSAGSGRRDTGQGAGTGPGHGKGAQGRGQGAQVHGAERGTVGEQAGQGVGDRGPDPGHGQGDRGVGAARGPKGKGRGATGPQGQAGRGMGARGGGRVEKRGAGDGAPPQPDVQPVRCIPPGIQQMPAHNTHHHRRNHHHHHLYNIDPDAGELIPPQPPRPRHQPAAPAPRAEPARMTSAGGGGGHRRRRHRGRRGSRREGQGEPGPGTGTGAQSRTLCGMRPYPRVGEVYGWLSWANQGTTRGLRNRPFHAVILRRDGGNREVPPGGWAAPEDHQRVLRSVIWAAWPDRGPTWPAVLEGGAVLRITDADANNWLPRALRSALAHWRYRRRNPPPPQPQPPNKRRLG